MKRICVIISIIVLMSALFGGCKTSSEPFKTTETESETRIESVQTTSSLTVTDGTSSDDVTLIDKDLIEAIDFSAKQLIYTTSIYSPEKYPHATFTNGEWNPKMDVGTKNEQDWIEGFLPGCLWYMYELTGIEHWREQAKAWTANVEWQKRNTGTADIGFRLVCSFGTGYRLTGDETYQDVLKEGSTSLGTRYNYYVHAVKNGDWYRWPEDRSLPAAFTLFNDDIMNVELMFMAGQFGHEVYTILALNHCLTTFKDIVREDGGSYHVVEYNAENGDVLWKHTYQGQGDETTWARGQAWLIYGFTMAYRYTKDPRMLEYAKIVTGYWMDNIPDDYVPYWDFQAEGIPEAVKDSAAAAVAVSALFELSTFCDDEKEKGVYFDFALNTLKSLSTSDYLAKETGCRAILLHGVGYYLADYNVDVGLIYGDYYYLEAMARYMNLVRKGSIH